MLGWVGFVVDHSDMSRACRLYLDLINSTSLNPRRPAATLAEVKQYAHCTLFVESWRGRMVICGVTI